MNITPTVAAPPSALRLRRIRSDHRLISVFVHSIVLACAVAMLLTPTSYRVALALSIIFGLLALAVARDQRRRWGVIGLGSPLTLITVSWFVYFGVAGLGAFASAATDSRLGADTSKLVLALTVCMLSLALVLVGSHIATAGRGGPGAGIASGPPLSIRPGALYVVLLGAWAARLYLIETGRYGFLSRGETYSGAANRAIELAGSGLTIALVVLVIAAWSPVAVKGISRSNALWLLGINMVPLVLSAVASGFKAQLFTELVPLAVAYLMVRGRVPWRALSGVVIYLVVVYSGVQDYRGGILQGTLGQEQTSGVVGAVGTSLTSIVEGWASESPTDHARSFWRHLTREYAGMLRNLAIILHRTPDEVPFLGVRRLITGPIFFVPLSALGDQVNLGQYVNTIYLNSTPTSSSPATQPGDFYLSGGWSALVFGQLLTGVFVGAVWRFTALRRRTMTGLVVYAAASAAFVNAGLDWGTLTRGLLQTIIAAWLITIAIRSRKSVAVQE